LDHLARIDSLTELPNRRAFDRSLGRAWATSERTRSPLALLMIDIDLFKSVNDRHGHPAGDDVLRRIAAAIGRRVRRSDEAFRFGGEEFAVLAPGTSIEGALVLAERIRTSVARERIEIGSGESRAILEVTVSVGVAVTPHSGCDSPTALVALA